MKQNLDDKRSTTTPETEEEKVQALTEEELDDVSGGRHSAIHKPPY